MTEFDRSGLEQAIGYTFRDQEILRRAMTHSSYVKKDKRNEPLDNERMEFLGDAVLELCVSEELFARYPDMREGQLSKTRAGIVCETALAQAARAIGLGSYLLLGHGEEIGGGAEKPSILSDAFEALIAGIYLDGGFPEAKRFIEKYVLPLLDFDGKTYPEKDYKTRLQELVHRKTHGAQVEYRMLGSEGPDHRKTFRMAVCLGDRILGTGEGNSKQSAGQKAAQNALMSMGEQA